MTKIEPEDTDAQRIAEEQEVQEKTDTEGNRWKKVYFGGGAHFRNWLSQLLEVWGEDNVQVEEVDSAGLRCFEESGEKTYRIWVKQSNREESGEES